LGDIPRILFFSPDTGAQGIDGPLTNAINVAKSFADSGFPAIFVYNGRNDVYDRFVETGADVRHMDFPVGSWKTHLNPLYRREYSKKLARIIKEERIEIIHLFPRAAYVTSYLKGLDILKVTQQPGTHTDFAPIRMFDNGFSFRPRRILNAWYRKYVRFNYSKADLVTGLGNAHQQGSIKVFGIPEKRTAVVHPGIAPQIGKADAGSLRSEFAVSTDEKVILSVGRITKAKGVEEFGQIARILIERGLSYRFLFAGYSVDDGYESAIRERYGKYVTFIGHRDDIPTCFADADIYLHPSHREGLPLAIMESMEFGLPTIAWNIPGCDELVTTGENGALFEFGDVTAAANEIERLLEDPNAYDAVSSAASRRFKEKHDIAEYAQRIMRIYQKALAKKARG